MSRTRTDTETAAAAAEAEAAAEAPAKARPARPAVADGRRRVVIEGVSPEVDAGRFPAKAIAGDDAVVEADVFTDGHDSVRAVLLYRSARQKKWREAPMEPVGNDRWRGSFPIPELGPYRFTIEAWVDHFATWRQDLEKRMAAGQNLATPLEVGAGLVDAAAERATGADCRKLREWASLLRDRAHAARIALPDDAPPGPDPLDPELAALVERHPDRSLATRYRRELALEADRERARFSAWYEFFPRSTGPTGRHGTLRDAARFLPYVQELGFDVVYLPPIHPIGKTKRKGPNNAVKARPSDPGSPWAIGGREGGHTAIHPGLGTLEDFRAFRRAAEDLGLEVALDIAFQCSPDHPWVAEHPEWFRRRPDGTIQFAENPPKKYEDIVPFDFETEEWKALWVALKGVFDFWIEQGVKIFRVDNPHTKPLPFWEWAIGAIRRTHPETIFLSEAFTRPKVMYRLAKAGFTQSYTYFAWRNAKWELEQYLEEVTRPPVADYFRPSFWPNTPDILTEHLQIGGRPTFISRLVLAATLASNYGIYGPAFELMESVPRERGSEEYRDSEKYQVRRWDLERQDSLKGLVARINRIRRQNEALHHTRTLRFHRIGTESLIAYSKRSPDGSNTILVIVNLDPHYVQSGWVELDLPALGLQEGESFQVHDLLSGGAYRWTGSRNYVELSPNVTPAHVFRIERRGPERSEHDFPYFM